MKGHQQILRTSEIIPSRDRALRFLISGSATVNHIPQMQRYLGPVAQDTPTLRFFHKDAQNKDIEADYFW